MMRLETPMLPFVALINNLQVVSDVFVSLAVTV
jgi:hypothetical protein